MRIPTLIIAISSCFLAGHAMAQTQQPQKYRKFAVYAGAGPSYFFNNLVLLKNDVKSFQYAASARVMWEPQHSKLSLGIETGYYRLYNASSGLYDSATNIKFHASVANSSVPIFFVITMKFTPKLYASWSMGQSITFSNVNANFNYTNRDSKTWSLSDFSATIGYRFAEKPRLSYAVEAKGFYSTGYDNTTIAILFIVGFRL